VDDARDDAGWRHVSRWAAAPWPIAAVGGAEDGRGGAGRVLVMALEHGNWRTLQTNQDDPVTTV
jgi:hypothetical protein